MSTVSDSADEFVKIMIDGTEVVARLTGSMAKEMAVMLYAMTKEKKKKTVGQTRLNNMLKSNSNLRIFSIKKEDFQDFKKQSKRYGVLYSALYKKGEINKDGIIDILVREEDAVRVNRIIERFKLTTVDQTQVETVLEKSERENSIIDEKSSIKEKNTSEDLVNKLLKKENEKEENENIIPSNVQNSEKEIQLENSLKKNKKTLGIDKKEKSSIREKIEKIKKENEKIYNSKVKEKSIQSKGNKMNKKQVKMKVRKGASRT